MNEPIYVYVVTTEYHYDSSDTEYVCKTIEGAQEKAMLLAGITDPERAIWSYLSDVSGEWWSLVLSQRSKVVIQQVELNT